jgi:GNAT superfamily N-acetyltransferase
MTIHIEPATSTAQIDRIARLASEIWYEYYVPLIGKAQVDYMVARFQSAAAMREQAASEDYRYFTIEDGATLLGYFAIQPQPAKGAMFISKLYLQARSRGRGVGRIALEFIERESRSEGLNSLWLTVNKGNPAVTTYRQWGFRIAEAIIMDIGNGFVMDDYRMEKPVGSVPGGSVPGGSVS